eukprot:CAMPEP_0180645632 /NCGR_PEP_ID=MMETSP1037_2-20121125/49108_1 /TAXON_ID=632150 /ORGANISM="Azadinium spinosum, Strain 3D9" /LENGTH=35 /DNA_ID= /DNA_START= /DNA_END= /DNA_ORIENTATION=
MSAQTATSPLRATYERGTAQISEVRANTLETYTLR